jgi:prepilin-type N-terminal cleavage/methylation domain-containing protein
MVQVPFFDLIVLTKSHPSKKEKESPLMFYNHTKITQGFTLIETLFVIVLLSVGFSAVFSMQFAEAEQTQYAKDLSNAVNLADSAITDFQKQSMMWTARTLPAGLNQADGNWHTFTPFPVNEYLQKSLDNDAMYGSQLKKQRYCIHYWLNPMDGIYDGLISGRIRVVWPKDLHLVPNDLCLEGNANRFDGTPNPNQIVYHITIPFILRRHPL